MSEELKLLKRVVDLIAQESLCASTPESDLELCLIRENAEEMLATHTEQAIAAQQKEVVELRSLLSRITSLIELDIHNGNLKMNLIAKQLLVDKAREILGESNGL